MRRAVGGVQWAGFVLVGALVAGCAFGGEPDVTEPGAAASPPASSESPDATDSPEPLETSEPTEPADTAEPPEPGTVRPTWLGTRVLPDRGDGIGELVDTPPELVNRRFPPPDAEPVEDGFEATVEEVPPDVLARSTWHEECPVTVDELRYLSMTHWGLDGRTYRGEMIVNVAVADDIVEVFRRLYEAEFAVEEMRVIAVHELDAPPTGDGNVTSSFVCREATQGTSWSEHAYGLAIDVNPFLNPYLCDAPRCSERTVLPELASAYLDRDRDAPGMIRPGDEVTAAFAAIGWGWGGGWSTLKDWMHFSRSGR